jgi:hypothetical protein
LQKEAVKKKIKCYSQKADDLNYLFANGKEEEEKSGSSRQLHT